MSVRITVGVPLILLMLLSLRRCSCVNLQTLRLVQVVHRHGDRAPVATYPTDPYQDVAKYWPNGLSQLTDVGKDQQYDLGSYLRQRYTGFLSALYSKKEIHVLSSDVDRVLVSAEANLQGLFPRLGGSHEHRLDLQLVPIHSYMRETDKLLAMKALCPKRNAEMASYKESPEIQQLIEDNRDLKEYLLEHMGFPWSMNLFEAVQIHDVLFCQQAHNLTLPAWATEEVVNKMGQLRAIVFAMKGATPVLKRLYGGPLVKRLMDNMVQEKTIYRRDEPKMYMHVAHDDTLAAVMSTMGVFDPQVPGYANMFIVELHQEEGLRGKYFVELFYRNRTDRYPYPLQVPGCGHPCYLHELKKLLKPVIPENWEKECQEGQVMRSSSKNLLQLSGDGGPGDESAPAIPCIIYQPSTTSFCYFLIVIAISVFIWLLILFVVKKRRDSVSINQTDYYHNDPPGYDKSSYVKMP